MAAAGPISSIDIHRTMSARMLNEVANNEAVRPWLGGVAGALDLSETISNPLNVALVTDGGGFICIKKAAGLYEVHSLFLPDSRAGRTVPAMRAAMLYMFTRTDCAELVTLVPDNNPHADTLAGVGGFASRFHRDRVWPAGDDLVGADYRTLTLEAWALASPECAATGRLFHDRLEAAKAAAGSALPTHDDDPAHDAIVGAAALMISAGNAEKAVGFFNRWAVVAGYRPAELLSLNPVVVDVGDAIVEATGDTMEVLLCR